MREWIPVYGSKHKRKFDEHWRCKGCGVDSNTDFNDGPKNICQCDSCKVLSVPNSTFQDNYVRIFGHE